MCSKKPPFFVTHIPRFFAAPSLESVLWQIGVFTLEDVFQKTAENRYTYPALFCDTPSAARSMADSRFHPRRCVPQNSHFLLHIFCTFHDAPFGSRPYLHPRSPEVLACGARLLPNKGNDFVFYFLKV